MGPNVCIDGTRYDSSVHLPRKDVLIPEPEVLKIQRAKAEASEKRNFQVLLYKLDQDKNALTDQRLHILNALKEYATKKGCTITITEATGVALPKNKEEREAFLLASSGALTEKYAPLKINVIAPELSTEAYHTLLAKSHVACCEGQSTGSQAMLYGTVVFHAPLSGQGVSIHTSNINIVRKSSFNLTAEQLEYTKTMEKHCSMIRGTVEIATVKAPKAEPAKLSILATIAALGKTYGRPDVPPVDRKVILEENFRQCIEFGLSAEANRSALEIARNIRTNPRLGMLEDCVALIQSPEHSVRASAHAEPLHGPAAPPHEGSLNLRLAETFSASAGLAATGHDVSSGAGSHLSRAEGDSAPHEMLAGFHAQPHPSAHEPTGNAHERAGDASAPESSIPEAPPFEPPAPSATVAPAKRGGPSGRPS